MSIAKLGDGHTPNQFHDAVGGAVRSRAGVEQPGEKAAGLVEGAQQAIDLAADTWVAVASGGQISLPVGGRIEFSRQVEDRFWVRSGHRVHPQGQVNTLPSARSVLRPERDETV